jgi:hypothetical protein
MMWPWRVQTTEGATGSAFAIAFANSYGQIGGRLVLSCLIRGTHHAIPRHLVLRWSLLELLPS